MSSKHFAQSLKKNIKKSILMQLNQDERNEKWVKMQALQPELK